MNENARRWAKALRSDEYEQGRRRLRIEGRYCCLGVACDLYNRHTGEGRWQDVAGEDHFLVDGDDAVVTLPDAVMTWLGLRDVSGEYSIDELDLASLNDEGTSFEEIAALIESEPEGLFVSEAS